MTPRQEIREAVVSFARRMHEDGLVSGTAGNVSARVPGEERIAITPSGFPYEEMEPDDVLVLDPGGAVVHGKLPPSVEWRVHLAVYRARPDVGAIIHTHGVHSTALAVLGRPLPPIVEEMVQYLGGQVEVAAYAPSQSPELARNVVAALGERAAVLMANHGNVCCAEDLAAAYHVCQVLEWVAGVYLTASLLGEPTTIPAAVVETARQVFEERKATSAAGRAAPPELRRLHTV